jgi:hypothetical protein
MTREYNTTHERYMGPADHAIIRKLYRTHSDKMIGDLIGRGKHAVRKYRHRHGLWREAVYPEVSYRQPVPKPRARPRDDGMTKLLAARW